MRQGIRLAVPIAATAAIAVSSLSSAGAAPAVSPASPGPVASPQTVTLNAYESRAQAATWQKRTWQKSRAYCMKKVKGFPNWRLRIKDGQCGTVVKTAPLAVNQKYTVTVSGLVSRWSGTWKGTCGSPIASHDAERGVDFNASADAQWTFATKRNKFRCGILAPHLPLVGAGFRVNTTGNAAPEGWRYPWMHQRKAYVKTDHSYTFTVKGAGKPVWFSIYDHYVTDNNGHFTIQLTPAGAPGVS